MATLFVIFSLIAGASGILTGTVTDAATGQPLGAAQVFLPGLNLGGHTNQQGRYLLSGVPEGEHLLRVELIGYQTAR